MNVGRLKRTGTITVWLLQKVHDLVGDWLIFILKSYILLDCCRWDEYQILAF